MPLPIRGRLRPAGLLVAAAASLSLIPLAAATAAVTTTPTAATLAAAVAAAGTPVTGATFSVSYPCTAGECPTGVSDTAVPGFPSEGASYGVITTGNAALADTPNTVGNSGEDWGVDASGTLGGGTFDNQTTAISLGAATGSCLAFDFKFLSEEYPEYLNTGYNDGFVAQLNTLAVSVDPATQSINAPGDFAAGSGDRISVDSSGPSVMTAENAAGTTYDGATTRLVARKAVAPGSTNTLYLTTFDQGDGIFDTAVFLDNLRYENLPAHQCKSLAVDPFEGTTGITVKGNQTAKLSKDKSSMSLPVACDLPPGPVPCTVTASLSVGGTSGARPASRAEALARTKVVAGGSSTIAPGTAATMTLATSKAGLKALTKAVDQPKTLKKKAASLTKKAAKASGAKKAKLLKKAAKLRKKATRLARKPVALTLTLVNPSNGVAETHKVTFKR